MADQAPENAATEPTEAGLLRWYTCQRKCRHPNERAATVAALALGGSVIAYECSRCDGWHVGNPSRRVAPNARWRRAQLVRRARTAWRKAGRPHVEPA